MANFCVNCVNYENTIVKNGCRRNFVSEVQQDLVTGENYNITVGIMLPAKTERYLTVDGCGPDGKYFVAKP